VFCSSRKRRPQRIAQRPADAPTESVSLQSFDGFGLDDATARAIAEEQCSVPIHVQTIPMVVLRRGPVPVRSNAIIFGDGERR
jgi:hypothetical protein